MPILLALLTISIPNGASDWPEDLPAAVQKKGGTFLPSPLDDEVKRRLLRLEQYPGFCQNLLDAEKLVGEAHLKAAVGLCTARCEADRATMLVNEFKWNTWHVVLVGSVALILGASVGFSYSTLSR